MSSLPTGQRHPVELGERATLMVVEHQDACLSSWTTIGVIAEQLDIRRGALRAWVCQAEHAVAELDETVAVGKAAAPPARVER